jgi:hypothetical protein
MLNHSSIWHHQWGFILELGIFIGRICSDDCTEKHPASNIETGCSRIIKDTLLFNNSVPIKNVVFVCVCNPNKVQTTTEGFQSAR